MNFRADIQGLRAVAVLMVLAFHAGVTLLPGGFAGVDVFFVISGFLITGLLVREVQRTGRVSLSRFYARRARRLLPAASVVLVATGLLSWAFLPATQWSTTGRDLVAAAFYVINWQLAQRSVDYLAEGSLASPVQHYWSLAVEEQFYVLWPLLIVVGAWLVRRYRRRVSEVLSVLLVTVLVCSFAWSVHLTAVSAPTAYFVSTTRLWELAVGGLVALAAPAWARMSRPSGTVLAWLGLLTVLGSALLLSPVMPWPGYAALAPTLGTAAVIAGGFCAGRHGPARLLGMAPMQGIGAMSYSLYLWHWPLMVIAEARWGPLALWQGLAVALFSFAPSWVTYRLIEARFRQAAVMRRVPIALTVGAACTVLGAVAGVMLLQGVERSVSPPPSARGVGAAALAGANEPSPRSSASHRSSAAVPVPDSAVGTPTHLADGGPDVSGLDLDPETITPSPLRAAEDLPSLYARGCQAPLLSTRVLRCDAGNPNGHLVLAVVGDSKIAQWGDALNEVAVAEGWRLRIYVRASCPWTAATVDNGGADPTCTQWGASLRDRLLHKERPDVVLVSGVKGKALQVNGRSTSAELAKGYVTYWSALAEAGVPVIALADTPRPGRNYSVLDCVAEHTRDVSRCSFPRNDGSGTPALKAAVEQVPGAKLLDMNDWICPLPKCPPVIGNVLVYRQGSHITNTYARSLVHPLTARLVPAVTAAIRSR